MNNQSPDAASNENDPTFAHDPDEIGDAKTRPVAHVAPGSMCVGQRVSGAHQFALIKKLGEGGFGSVFIGETLSVSAKAPLATIPEVVAIKFINSDTGIPIRALIGRELSALRALKCDRTPRVFDWCLDGPSPFIAMEYFPDGSLSDSLQEISALDDSVEIAQRLLTDLLTALVAAHRASIFHLDIKPANVLLDGRGGFVLTDFGISMPQASNSFEKVRTPGAGTMGYRAPEQADREIRGVDARTDLWGVAATVWSVMAGIKLNTRFAQDLQTEGPFGLPYIRKFKSSCPTWLADLIMWMLRTNPRERPGSAAEVLTAITAQTTGGNAPISNFVESRAATNKSEEVEEVVKQLIDPLWAAVLASPYSQKCMVRFDPGEVILKEGDAGHLVFILIQGTVRFEREGQVLGSDNKEGTFIGEISALTASPRTASAVAETKVWAYVLNTADFERFVSYNPAVGVRLMRELAHRVLSEYGRRG